MPPYERPELGARFTARFIRIGQEIFTGRNTLDNHQRIAQMDGIENEIEDARLLNPAEIDGGVFNITSSGDIYIAGESATFEIPVKKTAELAREITREAFALQSPEHKVIVI